MEKNLNWQTLINFRPRTSCTDTEVRLIEKAVKVDLPEDYRDFLLRTGGGYCDDALAPCDEPTPFGEMNITEFLDARSLREMGLASFAPSQILIVGIGHVGICTGLSLSGADRGRVYAVDSEFRHNWKPERYSRLKSESVQNFYKLRESNALAAKQLGYENCYSIASSFDEFLAKLHS